MPASTRRRVFEDPLYPRGDCEADMRISHTCSSSDSDTTSVATPDQGHHFNDVPRTRAMHQRQLQLRIAPRSTT